MKLNSINPKNLENINEIDSLTSEEINKRIELSSKVFNSWKKTSFTEKRALIKKLAKILSTDEDLPKLITNEVGKTLKASKMEL
ncbi:MAG: aldehyde dehydrogenase family protein, partial [Chryseobacterium sp.]